MRGATTGLQSPPTPPDFGSECQLEVHQMTPYDTADIYSSMGMSREPMRLMAHEDVPLYWSGAGNQQRGDFALRPQFNGYGSAAEYYQDGEYHDFNNEQRVFGPLTPRSAVDDDIIRRTTRDRRAPASSSSPQNVEQSPRPRAIPRTRKLKTDKADKSNMPKLTAPLSVIKTNFRHIPIKDMSKWVHRSTEVRHGEVEEKKGYIARPMNSFMLYRSAYAEVAKAWCSQNNHQVLSSVAGQSWPLEPAEIRDRYNEYAKTERINHQIAHPRYKFSPSKTASLARRRKREGSDDEETSDFEDADCTTSRGTSHSRHSRKLNRPLSCPRNESGIGLLNTSSGPGCSGLKRSSRGTTHQGRPMLIPAGQNDACNQYYQPIAYPGLVNQSFLNDMRLQEANAPASAVGFQPNPALFALPNSNASGTACRMPPQHELPFNDHQLDPMLLAFENSSLSHIDPAALQQYQFRTGQSSAIDEESKYYNMENLTRYQSPAYDLQDGSWQPDQAVIPLGQESEQELEFDKWMGEH